jgi:hypothetical protein
MVKPLYAVVTSASLAICNKETDDLTTANYKERAVRTPVKDASANRCSSRNSETTLQSLVP